MSNDRFKFRIWDDTHKHYLPKSDAIIDGRTGSKLHGSLFSVVYIIEQCTGVKDKNGKLIYEGDVIHFYVEFDDGMVIDRDIVVEWDDSNCGFDFWQSPDCVSEYGEIIGNIHEVKND